MKIGQRIIETATDQIRALMVENGPELDKAYLKAEGPLTITCTIKLKSDEDSPGNVEVDTGISFVLEKVKANMTSSVNESQMELFEAVKDGRVTIEAK
jgi:hypothetical protein